MTQSLLARRVPLNLRSKPHLRVWHGQWECIGIHSSILGPTLEYAFGRWCAEEALRKDRMREQMAQVLVRASQRRVMA